MVHSIKGGRLWRYAGAVALLAISLPHPALANFGQPVPISVADPDADPLNSDFGMTRQGDAVIVWQQRYRPEFDDCQRIMSRFRDRSGNYGPAQVISLLGEDESECPNPGPSTTGIDSTDPQVAVDAGANAVAVWLFEDEATDAFVHSIRVQARYRSRAGVSELEPVVYVSPHGEDAQEPQIAMDRDGDAIVVWRRVDDGTFPGTNPRIKASVRVDSTFAPAIALSSAGDVDSHRVAMNADGAGVVVWQRNGIIQTRVRPAGGAFGPILNISAPSASEPEVAIDSEGDILFVWQRRVGVDEVVQARILSAAGVLGALRNISPFSTNPSFPEESLDPEVAVDADGDALIAWFNAVNGGMRGRTLSKTGTLGAQVTFAFGQALNGGGGVHDVAMDGNGDAVVIWPDQNSDLIARYRARDGTLGPVDRLNTNAESSIRDQQVEMTFAGNALAVWTSSTFPNIRVRVSSGP